MALLRHRPNQHGQLAVRTRACGEMPSIRPGGLAREHLVRRAAGLIVERLTDQALRESEAACLVALELPPRDRRDRAVAQLSTPSWFIAEPICDFTRAWQCAARWRSVCFGNPSLMKCRIAHSAKPSFRSISSSGADECRRVHGSTCSRIR
jgi:hypothetical protein